MSDPKRNKKNNQKSESKTKTYDILLIILGIAAIFVFGFMLYSGWQWLFGGNNGDGGQPPVAGTDPWERIQANGKIVVGTAADYPPFAHYDDNFQLTGFDIALMREVGQQLGVEVEFKDMAFDSLATAVTTDQVDAAIGAISITPERDGEFDFTNPYYISEDATLARADLNVVQFNSIQEMAPYRIGVQSGSVFEQWAQTELVNTGLMPQSNLFVYQDTEQGARDLTNGQIDLVIVDMPVAQKAVASMNVKVVSENLNRQRYAIGMKNGASTLQNELNTALNTLQNSGRVAQLAQEYMGVDEGEIVPIPTPEATNTPAPTATAVACTTGMAFVDDLNLEDDNMKNPPQIPAGQPFRKWWRIRNSGTCTWDSNYYLVYDGGNNDAARMGGNPTPIQGTVSPGGTYDIYVDLIAPFQPGIYQGFWTMQAPDGKKFGTRMWVGIEVPGPNTPTPAPTQTPSPNISFTVDRTNIKAGECVTFQWNVQGMKATYFYQQGANWPQYQVAPQGAQGECPPVTTTYELRVTKQDDSQEIRQTVIYVEAAPGAPVIERFTVDPSQINVGQCVDIRWEVKGQIDVVRIYQGGVVIRDNAPVSGTQQECPVGPGTAVYTIEAIGAGGNSRLQRNVTIVQPTSVPATNTPYPTDVPPPTATPKPPVINSFTVNPGQIPAGECVTVSWNVSGSTEYVRLLKNGQVVLDGGAVNGSVPDCLNQAGSYTYRLEAVGANNQSATEERLVTVTEATVPDMPLQETNWMLESYYDGFGAVVDVIDGSEVTAVFETNNKLNGEGGCNVYNADYQLTANTVDQIIIQEPAGGQMACSNVIMTQENTYFGQLTAVVRYEITGDKLEMYDEDDKLILVFEAVVASPY